MLAKVRPRWGKINRNANVMPGKNNSSREYRKAMMVGWKNLAAIIAGATIHASAAYAIECPAAPQNVAREIVTDTQGSVSGLKFVVGGDLRNRVEITAKNLFEKYPNADRVTVSTLMMSQFCQLIVNSPQLSDKEKLEQLDVVNERIITLMTAPAK